MPTHPCPICRRLTAGTATEGGLRFTYCPDCLETPIAELATWKRMLQRMRPRDKAIADAIAAANELLGRAKQGDAHPELR